MRKLSLILAILPVPCLAFFAWMEWLDANSSNTTLERLASIRPHATLAEVRQILGPPDATCDAPVFPPWLTASALGKVKEGTVLIYDIKLFHPKILLIHILPDSGVQFVTWVPT